MLTFPPNTIDLAGSCRVIVNEKGERFKEKVNWMWDEGRNLKMVAQLEQMFAQVCLLSISDVLQFVIIIWNADVYQQHFTWQERRAKTHTKLANEEIITKWQFIKIQKSPRSHPWLRHILPLSPRNSDQATLPTMTPRYWSNQSGSATDLRAKFIFWCFDNVILKLIQKSIRLAAQTMHFNHVILYQGNRMIAHFSLPLNFTFSLILRRAYEKCTPVTLYVVIYLWKRVEIYNISPSGHLHREVMFPSSFYDRLSVKNYSTVCAGAIGLVNLIFLITYEVNYR